MAEIILVIQIWLVDGTQYRHESPTDSAEQCWDAAREVATISSFRGVRVGHIAAGCHFTLVHA